VHRLQFTKADTDLLAKRVESLFSPATEDHISAILKGEELWSQLLSIVNEPDTPNEHQYIYDSIKNKVDQRYWQVMYHTSLKRIPLLINHKDPIVVAIAMWRLEIAR